LEGRSFRCRPRRDNGDDIIWLQSGLRTKAGDELKVDGSCYCGKITFEADAQPEGVSICHCTDCQHFSGSAFRISVAAPVDRFKIIQGTPKEYIKTAASGARRIQAFCADCGTALYATALEEATTYNIRAGTLRQRGMFSPSKQIWRDSALGWVPEMSQIKTCNQESD
jgi:hypothetical protein